MHIGSELAATVGVTEEIAGNSEDGADGLDGHMPS